MNPSFKPKPSGFSLIELMIGIAVLAISLTLAMPSFRIWMQNTQIRNTAESIQNGMKRARAEAVSRNTNTAFTLGGANYWTITQVNDGSVIETKPGSEISPNVTRTVSPVAIPPAAAPTTITFSNLGTVLPNADASITITQVDIDSSVLAPADSRELRITVGVGGGVRMCDPNVATVTDPRHCL